jgi:hypothetical protein
MNKLDTFNKDKVKCEKCKKYYDKNKYVLCSDCLKKWQASPGGKAGFFVPISGAWEDFLNEQ